MIELIPFVVGLFTENKEVVNLAAQNKELLLGSSAAILLDFIFRAIPQKEHKSILTVLITACEVILAGAKKLDAKLSVKKNDKP